MRTTSGRVRRTAATPVMSGIALIALLLGAVLMAFAQWLGRLVRLWVPIVSTVGMLGITFLGTTFVPAVAACAVLTIGLLAQADGLRRCPDAVYATGGRSGSNEA